jgi:predicted acylesterase/phospholipase RssA
MIRATAVVGILAAATPIRPQAADKTVEPAAADRNWKDNGDALHHCQSSEQCVLTFASGGSRGAYQAGAALKLISELWGDGERPTGPQRDRTVPDLAIAGSSAGGLNALMAGLLWCLHDDERKRETELNNFMLETWADLNLDSLFPGDRSCVAYRESHPELGLSCTSDSPYQESDGILTRNAFLPIRARLVDLLDSRRFRPGCRVPIALALTAERQSFVKLGSQTVPASRRTLIFELRTREKECDEKECDEKDPKVGIHVCQAPSANVAASRTRTAISDVDSVLSIRLPELAWTPESAPCQHWVDRQSMLDSVIASAALPPLISPQRLDFCAHAELGCRESPRRDVLCPRDGPRSMKLCQERFIDGGVFDSRPVTAAHEVSLIPFRDPRDEPRRREAHRERELRNGKTMFVVVAPAPVEEGTSLEGPWQRARGVDFYEPFVRNFFEVGRQYELQTLLRYIPDVEVVYIQPTQWLVGDYVGGYAALVDRRFAVHDYLAGFCFTERPDPDRKHPCTDVPPIWNRDTALVRKALIASHAAGSDPRAHAFEVFLESLGQSGTGDCRFANSSPPIWCASGDGAFQRRPGDGRAKDLPYLSDFSRWSYELGEQLLARAEVVERRNRNTTVAKVLAAGGFYAAMRAADVSPGIQLGSYTALPRSTRNSVGGMLGLLVPSEIGVESMYYGRLRLDWSVLSFRTDTSWLRIAAGAFFEPAQDTWALATGPFLETWTRIEPLPRVGDFGLRARYDLNGDYDSRAFRPELFVRPFFGRVELNASVQFGRIESRHPPLRVGFGIALTDIRGLLYWVAHVLGGSDGNEGGTAPR